MRKLLLFAWTVAFLFLRPSIFGEKYNAVVFALFLLFSVLIIGLDQKAFSLTSKRFITLLLISLCLLYLLVQGLILSEASQIVIRASAFLLLAIPCLALVLNRHQELILKIFINFHYYLSISAIITFAIFLVKGLSIYKLPILASLYEIVEYAVFDPKRPLSNHVLIFPYTVVWSTVDLFGVSFPRFVGIYREPGMAQIFFVTALIFTFFIPVRHRDRKRVVILTGCLLLFSAAGVLNLLLAGGVYVITNTSLRQNIVSLLRKPIFILFILVSFFFLGKLAIKMTTEKLDDLSGETRIDSFKLGLTRLAKDPVFGAGYYNAFEKDESGKVVLENNIGIIGISFQIGLVGLILYFVCWWFSLSQSATQHSLAIYLPGLLTLLFFQPSYNDAFVWFLLLLDTSGFRSGEAGVKFSTADHQGLVSKY